MTCEQLKCIVYSLYIRKGRRLFVILNIPLKQGGWEDKYLTYDFSQAFPLSEWILNNL